MNRILFFINKKNLTTQREVSDIIDKKITSKNSLYISDKVHDRFKRELLLKNINFIEVYDVEGEILQLDTFRILFDNKYYQLYIPLNKKNSSKESFEIIKKVVQILKSRGYSVFDINSLKVYPNDYDIISDIKQSIKNRHLHKLKKIIFEYWKIIILLSFFVFIGVYSKQIQVLIPIVLIILLVYVVKDIQKEIDSPKKRTLWYALLFVLHGFTAITYLFIKYFKSNHFKTTKENWIIRKEKKLINNKRNKELERKILNEINKESFWKIIDYSKKISPNNKELQINLLVDILTEIDVKKLVLFAEIREYFYAKSYTSNLWAIAYMLNAGCSDDSFDYYRNWLISEGKQKYFALLENPENVVEKYQTIDEINGKTENFGSIEILAFEKNHKESIDPQYDFDEIFKKNKSDKYIFDLPEMKFNWNDENDLKKLFPKFYQKFNTF